MTRRTSYGGKTDRRSTVSVRPHARGWPKARRNQRVHVSGHIRRIDDVSEIEISKTTPKAVKIKTTSLSSHADRGRDAEWVFENAFHNKATIKRDSRGHDFFLTFPNGQKWYVDVKRIEQSVSNGSKSEPGRVQIERVELKRWLEIERERDCTSWLVVAVRNGNHFKWRRIKAKDVGPLVEGKEDPYKLTMVQVETMEKFSL